MTDIDYFLSWPKISSQSTITTPTTYYYDGSVHKDYETADLNSPDYAAFNQYYNAFYFAFTNTSSESINEEGVKTKAREVSFENKINDNREHILETEISPLFLKLIKEEVFEFGYTSSTELLIREQLKINALATRNWLNKLFIENFQNQTILIGILRILGRFEENDIFPHGQTMALAAIVHKSAEIKELGVRAFENWGSMNSLTILKAIKVEPQWVQDYIDQVTLDLESEYAIAG